MTSLRGPGGSPSDSDDQGIGSSESAPASATTTSANRRRAASATRVERIAALEQTYAECARRWAELAARGPPDLAVAGNILDKKAVR